MQTIEFISITADPQLARRLWALPGHTVMVDLEIVGKRERQLGRDTVISAHGLSDVRRLAELPNRGPLIVRTNALGMGCLSELEACLDLGVARFMFPMFRSRNEVDRFLEALEARASVTLLVETDSAATNIEAILRELPLEVDHIHIGLNDLSLGRQTPFLFEPVASGELERLSEVVRRHNLRFGFGGIGGVGYGAIPGERLIGEHVRVGSTVVILSRTFHSNVDPREFTALELAVQELRAWEAQFRESTKAELEANRKWLEDRITLIVDSRRKSRRGRSS